MKAILFGVGLLALASAAGGTASVPSVEDLQKRFADTNDYEIVAFEKGVLYRMYYIGWGMPVGFFRFK